ncbi:MAG: N-acetyl-alpha-D-glucosaminyl L-malate synthase BshA [Candidatus Eisenbacteria bacterium]|nr:N-acetyl-alpha-D-glucosaminyl L-malate synthase BshA [Candidatus Eisenbacteria bacterium]MCC7141776.1 N-acetyl-alpha-D-glucosaminyl L-malate synthase BshA [Candidatus Eisenbacteria bacterium]
MAKRKLGIVCYPSSGGSGIVATELGLALARRDWEVHFITYALPVRLKGYEENVFFHEVQTDNYPVFHHPPYTLSLAVKITEVAETHGLDLLHVHYAIPHATCAYLAREMLKPKRLPVVTTLHGTDITLVGMQPSFHKVVRFSIDESDRVTAVSDFLRRRTIESFQTQRPIQVIPNFVDVDRFRPGAASHCRFRRAGEKVVLHASNFRAVKNVPAVIRAFAEAKDAAASRLVMVGDGPERWPAQTLARDLGVEDRVQFLGLQDGMEEILSQADIFLLPSEHESFGLAALEAMASGVAVIATTQGGTSEVIEDGVSGYLRDPHDIHGMAESLRELLRNDDLRASVGAAARRRAVEEYSLDRVVAVYQAMYDELVEAR